MGLGLIPSLFALATLCPTPILLIPLSISPLLSNPSTKYPDQGGGGEDDGGDVVGGGAGGGPYK